MKKWLVLLVTALAGAALAGTVLGQGPAPKAQWVVGLNEEAESVDPASSVLFASDIYHMHMFDSLVGLEGEELKPVPLLAERWEIVNPTTWRFHLRKGVKFHNGDSFDAKDVKYSFETYLDPKSRRDVQSFLENLRREHGTTILLTTHDMAEAERLCARIGFLAHGRLTAQGTAATLKQQAGCATLEDTFVALSGEGFVELS